MPPRELPKRYDSRGVESRIYDFWEKGRFFESRISKKSPFVIVIPPPNVTGALHMGHALNETIQDILIRFKRMQGLNALWLPGTDHAGIATQNVVERELAAKNTTRQDLGRERFLEEVWRWKEEYGSRIIEQLKRLGNSCDWSRTRFTMDEGLSKAVIEAFVTLYERGYVYRGLYIINWCPRCHTALAEDEVEKREESGKLWYLRYPLKGKEGEVTVATTRPETMLGDTAVAVNPSDERFKNLIGTKLILPLIGREMPVIADDFVDPAFGTGCVKVTPAHDPNDFEMGKRHGLESVNVMREDGVINENGEPYAGLDRFEARKKVVADLKEQGLLAKIEDYTVPLGHCYRCDTIIEPRLSDQWFVSMKPLAAKAIEATESGRVRFHPERWTKEYLRWLNEVRDWCISRQIWWGHRIPAYYCSCCDHVTVARQEPAECGECGCREFRQDEDVLDTWFSSALWPFSTFGWPEKKARKELDYYYPTDVLVTDRGIIYFWVARMVMMGLELMENVPFSDVYIHGTILDEIGRKMSKSLGNGIDPIEMIDRYGADAVRFSLIMLTAEGQDVRLSVGKFEMGRNFCNKLWNATRFALMNLEEVKAARIELDALQFEDKWILSRLHRTIEGVSRDLEQYHFNSAIQTLYAFFWHDFCDWYLESIKGRMRSSDAAAASVLAWTLDNALRMLHPFIPFITEELWGYLDEAAPRRGLRGGEASRPLMTACWPGLRGDLLDGELEERMGVLQDVVRAVRLIRNKQSLGEKTKLDAVIKVPSEQLAQFLQAHEEKLSDLALIKKAEISVDAEKPPSSAAEVAGEIQVFVPLAAGQADIQRKHLKKKLRDVESMLARSEAKLNNEAFLNKAKPEVVEREKARLKELVVQKDKMQEALELAGEGSS
jgi:valyl-tRNA synthetase